MGLRLINNISGLKASRHLNQANSSFAKSLERLSSGLRINRGADAPAGLIISEQLRAQISGLRQAVINSQDAINVIGTAEGALAEVNSILLNIRRVAIDSANIGTIDQNQLNANQAEVDSALNTIDRIANSTQYAGIKLLNGAAGFELTDVDPSVDKVRVDSIQLGTAETKVIKYKVDFAAEFASISIDISSILDLDTTIQLTGSKGSLQISFKEGSTLQEVADAVDALHENTGVTARVEVGSIITFSSTDVGNDQFVVIDDLDGNGFLLGGIKNDSNEFNSLLDRGKDIEGTINGAVARGRGRTLSINSSTFAGTIRLDYASSAGTTDAVASDLSLGVTGREAARVVPKALPETSEGSFKVNNEGLLFQLGAYTNPNFQKSTGIIHAGTYNLGQSNGRLSSLKSGGTNDLGNNPERAVKIVDEAILDISSMRARLGAFEANTLDTNINSLGVAIENISSSESRIRDLDFATEVANLTRNQILVGAGISILLKSNFNAESILALLS